MQIGKQLASGVLTGITSTVVRIIVTLATLPLLVGHLASEVFGLYLLVVGVVDIIQLLDFVSGGIIRILVDYQAQSQDEDYQRMLRFGNTFFLVLSIVVLLLGWLCIPAIVSAIKLSEAVRPLATFALAIILVEGALGLYGAYHRAILRLYHRNYWVNIGDIAFNLGVCAATVFFLAQGVGIGAILLARLVLGTLRFILWLHQSSQAHSATLGLSFSWPQGMLRRLGDYSFFGMINNSSSLLSARIDATVIATMLRVSLVGTYELVLRLLSPCNQIAWKIMDNFYPYMMQLYARKEEDRLQRLFLRVSSFLQFLTISMLTAFWMFSPQLFAYFSAGKIDAASIQDLLWVNMAIVWNGILMIPASQVLFATDKYRYHTMVNLVAAVANFALSLWMAPKLGIVGVALGTLIPQTVQVHGFLIRKAIKTLNLNRTHYFQTVMLKTLPALLLNAALLILFSAQLHYVPNALVGVILASIVAFAASFAVWVMQNASDKQKQQFREKLDNLFKLRVKVQVGAANE